VPRIQPDQLESPRRRSSGREVAQAARRLTLELVLLARERGATWAEVGAAFGISRQAACERFDGRRD